MKLKLMGFLMALGLLTSCGSEDRTFSSVGLSVTGKVGEILVVCENDLWKSGLKECLDSNLTQFIMPYFPDVATFELIHKTPKHFNKGVQRYRNTLFLEIDKTLEGKAGVVERKDDVWATSQLVIEIKAGDFKTLTETCVQRLDQVHDLFEQREWSRIMEQYQRSPNGLIRKKVEENFGIELALPSQSRLLTTRNNFYRIEFPSISRPIEFVGTGSQDAGNVLSGVMIYQYDFIDSSQLTLESLLRARDTMPLPKLTGCTWEHNT